MVVIPRLVYNFNHSKPGPFAEKSLLKQTLEQKSLSPHDGELCFSFSSPKMQMIAWHLRRSTWFTWFPLEVRRFLRFPWFSPGSPEIPVKSIIWLQVPALQQLCFFCMEDSIPSYRFFRPIWCFEITKTARCFSRVIFVDVRICFFRGERYARE